MNQRRKWADNCWLTMWSFLSLAICMCLTLSCTMGLNPKTHQRLVLPIWWGPEENEILGVLVFWALLSILLQVWRSGSAEESWESGPGLSFCLWSSLWLTRSCLRWLFVEVRAVGSVVTLCFCHCFLEDSVVEESFYSAVTSLSWAYCCLWTGSRNSSRAGMVFCISMWDAEKTLSTALFWPSWIPEYLQLCGRPGSADGHC